MPNTRSAAKRVRQNLKRRTRNQSARSEIRTLTKRCREAIAAGELDEARRLARLAESRLDKAAKKSMVHRNNARRRAMRLHRAVSKAVAAAEGAEA